MIFFFVCVDNDPLCPSNVGLSNPKSKLLFNFAPRLLALLRRDLNLNFYLIWLERVIPWCSLMRWEKVELREGSEVPRSFLFFTVF